MVSVLVLSSTFCITRYGERSNERLLDEDLPDEAMKYSSDDPHPDFGDRRPSTPQLSFKAPTDSSRSDERIVRSLQSSSRFQDKLDQNCFRQEAGILFYYVSTYLFLTAPFAIVELLSLIGVKISLPLIYVFAVVYVSSGSVNILLYAIIRTRLPATFRLQPTYVPTNDRHTLLTNLSSIDATESFRSTPSLAGNPVFSTYSQQTELPGEAGSYRILSLIQAYMDSSHSLPLDPGNPHHPSCLSRQSPLGGYVGPPNCTCGIVPQKTVGPVGRSGIPKI